MKRIVERIIGHCRIKYAGNMVKGKCTVKQKQSDERISKECRGSLTGFAILYKPELLDWQPYTEPKVAEQIQWPSLL
ncbi:hypothetical protein [Paenibacillus sp. RC67]|uniref:hypothetical protein n=1 Tax=Paenibacillus sp. RC67 TaxID=3039392 RepID=UPI0024ACD151|nr:hypothetical protein [Paenibacillus sp. RC67]